MHFIKKVWRKNNCATLEKIEIIAVKALRNLCEECEASDEIAARITGTEK